MRNRRFRSGHVMLPMFGIVYFLPWFIFAGAVLSGWSSQQTGGGDPERSILGVLKMTCCVGVPLYLIGLCLTIFFAISTEELEAWAQRVGLGAPQYWCGKNVREKLARELTRFLHFASALLLGYLTARWLFPNSLDLRLSGAAAFAHGYVILLFVGVIAPLHRFCPTLLGFKGDPAARYQHVF